MTEPLTNFSVNVGGADLPVDVHTQLVRVEVDHTVGVPSLFALEFLDAGRQLVTKAGFQIGKEVTISAKTGGGSKTELIKAEITALELRKDAGGGLFTIVRGFDKGHRLQRGGGTVAYLNKAYHDIVAEVINRAGGQVGRIDQVPGGAPAQVNQLGMTDWDFLRRIAQLTGFRLITEGGKIYFVAPQSAAGAPSGSAGPPPAPEPLVLRLGSDVNEVRAVVTAAAQVGEVEVRGWDVTQKKEIVSKKTPKTMTVELAKVKLQDLSSKFSAKRTVVAGPYGTVDEVETAAQALATEIASGHAELEGATAGNPALKAGIPVALANGGPPFDGKYTLNSVTHLGTPASGFVTRFRASGLQDRSLIQLTSGGLSSGAGSAHLGLTVGIVTDLVDPDDLGRVKVELPRYAKAGDFVTGWARVVHLGASATGKRGGARGLFMLPEVNDEVLVGFEHGDPDHPFVLGSLVNSKDRGLPGKASASEASESWLESDKYHKKGKLQEVSLRSTQGHMIQMVDVENTGMVIESADKKMRIVFDQGKQQLLVQSDHDNGIMFKTKGTMTFEADKEVKFVAKDKFIVDAKSDMTIKSATKMSFEAQSKMGMKVGGTVSELEPAKFAMKSAQVEVAGQAKTTVKGTMVEVNGSGVTIIKGGIVKIN